MIEELRQQLRQLEMANHDLSAQIATINVELAKLPDFDSFVTDIDTDLGYSHSLGRVSLLGTQMKETSIFHTTMTGGGAPDTTGISVSNAWNTPLISDEPYTFAHVNGDVVLTGDTTSRFVVICDASYNAVSAAEDSNLAIAYLEFATGLTDSPSLLSSSYRRPQVLYRTKVASSSGSPNWEKLTEWRASISVHAVVRLADLVNDRLMVSIRIENIIGRLSSIGVQASWSILKLG